MIVEWDSDINTTILRDGTSWSDRAGFITDETRSGKQKRRMAHAQGQRSFSVTMHFTEAEYQKFKTWYTDSLYNGFYSFSFPKIDSVSKSTLAVYQFTEDGVPQYSNIGGDIIECQMTWEEVKV